MAHCAVERDRRQRAQRVLDRRCVLAGEREVGALHDGEVEDEVQLVTILVAEEGTLLDRVAG